MNGATLESELRSFTGTTSSNYSQTNVFLDLNKSYHYIEDCITENIGENYFYQEVTSDITVDGQKEYVMDVVPAGNLDGVNKTLGVSIDYGNDTFVKAVKVDINSLEHDPSWYEINQPTSSPIYTIQDNSVMIFPVPTALTVGYIKMYIIQNLIDITSATLEDDMFNGKIQTKYHPLIALGAEQYSYQRRQMFDKAQESEQRFHGKLFGEYAGSKYVPGMLDLLNTRNRGARIRQMPAGFNIKL